MIRFIQRKLDVEMVSLQLLPYSIEYPNTYITEQELERFIFHFVQRMPSCQQLDPAFFPYYVFTATRRFFFFLDPKRSRRIGLKKLVHSAVMEEFISFQQLSRCEPDRDTRKLLSKNWFSCRNALKIYSKFIGLDKDQNGELLIFWYFLQTSFD